MVQQQMSTANGELQDWMGHDITSGSKILYPQRRGTHMWMVLAEVLEISVIHDHLAMIDKWALKVQPVKTTFYFGQSFGKPVTITVLDKVTVIEGCK
jgi:hypothetical protein